jgi:hypothetical protein
LNIINVLLLFPSLPFEFIFKYPAKIKDFLLTLKKMGVEPHTMGKYFFFLASRFKLYFWSPDHRILLGNICYYGLRNQLESKLLNKGTKCKIYRTLTRSIVLNGSESWTLTKADEENLRIFERIIMRRIYGPTCANGVWRIKYNVELYGSYKDLDIVTVIKVARIRWLGHLVRMEEIRLAKR